VWYGTLTVMVESSFVMLLLDFFLFVAYVLSCFMVNADEYNIQYRTTRFMWRIVRAGFSLSRALFRQKCVGPSPGRQTLFFLEKLGDLLWSSLSLLFTRSLGCRPIVSGILLRCKILAAPLVGPLFCGSPCSAEHAEHA